MAVPVFLLDSFPARTFSGNVAGVVLLESAAPDWCCARSPERPLPATSSPPCAPAARPTPCSTAS